MGSLGEAFALAFLQGQGLTLVGRNWRNKTGEIDLIMQDQNQLVFVEVKTRWAGSLVSALELVTPLKLDKLKHLSLAWLSQNGWRNTASTQLVWCAILACNASGSRNCDDNWWAFGT